MLAVFDFTKKHLQKYGPSRPPEIWQEDEISRAGGPVVHYLEINIFIPALECPSCATA